MGVERYYFIGIGGVGMSGLAEILLERGKRVAGSDLKRSPQTEALEKRGAQIVYKQVKENIVQGDVVIYSSAIQEGHPEFAETKRLKNLCFHRSVLLEKFLLEKRPLIIAGAHGKTTTSALLAHILTEAGLDPSYAIGGFLGTGKRHAHEGKGSYFVAESDESDGSFLRTHPYGAIVTNIDADHLDYWKSKEPLFAAYEEFMSQVEEKELLFTWFEDPIAGAMRVKGKRFGFSPHADYHITHYRPTLGGTLFSLSLFGKESGEIFLPLLGRHNLLNALGAIGLAHQLGLPIEKIGETVKTFQGVKRRLEYKGEFHGASFYDDYAHHPEEVKASLSALREAYPDKKIIAIFQPHRYTRFLHCFEEFAHVLPLADEALITDIYSAGEEKIEGVTSALLLQKLEGRMQIHYTPKGDLPQKLEGYFDPANLLVSIGAGDITELAEQCKNRIPR